jgi:Txe/YoeB family toxin of Txe-Axe toxin-antitoxin module
MRAESGLDRFVYQVLEEEKVVKVLRLWTHYE